MILDSRSAFDVKARSEMPVEPTPAATIESRKREVESTRPTAKIDLPPILLEGDEPALGRRPRKPAPQVSGLLAARGVETDDLFEAPCVSGSIAAVPRDPTSLYATWDFTTEEQHRANEQSVHGHMVLLVWKGEPGTGKAVSEIHVHPESRHWFINVPAPGAAYSVELGYYNLQRCWCTVAVSEVVHMPGTVAREESEPVFTTVQIPADRPELATARREESGTSGEAEQERTDTQETTDTHDSVTEISNLRSQPLPQTDGEECLRSDQTQSDSQAPAGQWTEAQAREILELAGAPSESIQGLSSLEVLQQLAKALGAGPVGPSSAESAPAEQAPIEGPGVAGVSSELLTQQPSAPERKFWLKVNAELVIYGSTERDASVSIGGRAIRLREDGSFSYRFSLPDGAYELPVAATSKDGERRAAALGFSRKTSLSGEVGAHPQDPALKPPEGVEG